MDATHHDGWWEALFYGDSREIGSAYWSLVTMHFRYTTCWFHVYYRKSVYWKYYHGSFTLKRGGGERDFLKDANGLQCVFMDISALKQLSNASWDSLRNIKPKEKGGVVFGHHCIYADFPHKTFYFSNTTMYDQVFRDGSSSSRPRKTPDKKFSRLSLRRTKKSGVRTQTVSSFLESSSRCRELESTFTYNRRS